MSESKMPERIAADILVAWVGNCGIQPTKDNAQKVADAYTVIYRAVKAAVRPEE